MRKFISIALIALFFFGNTEAYQLLKLPLLVKHYIKHKHEDPAISFIAFLQLHYQDKTVVDADFQQDMQLPFKTNDAKMIQLASVSLPSPRISIEILPTPVVKKTLSIHHEQLYSLNTPHDIFQPPKIS